MMNILECLPNELFIEIFSYLTTVDTIIAFMNVNQRFQCLINEFCQLFDFKLTSKTKFDIIFKYYDVNQCKSLRISDDNNETPGQINYFFDNYSFENSFIQLKSLFILGMKNFHKQKFLLQLPFLSNLILLQIESICGKNIPEYDFPKLKKLIISSCRHINWIKNFSQIENIEYRIKNCCFDQEILIWPKNLKHLKVIVSTNQDILSIQSSFTDLSQLITLEIYQETRGRNIPDGQIWEKIICSSLPLLKTFKFYFEFFLRTSDQLQQIVNSFATPFYTLEKHWFCQGELYPVFPLRRIRRSFAILYSLPYPCEILTIRSNRLSKYSSIPINNLNTNIKIKTLVIETHKQPTRIYNGIQITNLIVKTCFDPTYWLSILTKLHHLNLEKCRLLTTEKFCLLLDNTPYLYSLTLKYSLLKVLTNNWSNVSVCNHLSRKIRSLKLGIYTDLLEYLNRNDLEHIVSIFASKCEYLSICVQSKIDTVDYILSNMNQLNSLHVYLDKTESSPITIEWLEEQKTPFNHSNCILVHDRNDYYFWLENLSS